MEWIPIKKKKYLKSNTDAYTNDNTGVKTKAWIYETYKWEISKKYTLKLKIKTLKYYYYNNEVNNRKFNADLLQTDKKSYKNIDIYYIGCVITKYYDDEDVDSVSPLNLTTGKAEEYIEEKNGKKYLIFASSDKNKKVLQNTQNFGIKLKI